MTDNAAETGRSLLAWLREQPIKGRWMSGLERDLDVIIGDRPAATGYTGVLAGLTPERFVEELHSDNGGQVGQVYRFGRQALADLREALPAPTADGTVLIAVEGKDTTESSRAAPEPAEAAAGPSQETPLRRRRQRRTAPPELASAPQGEAPTSEVGATPEEVTPRRPRQRRPAATPAAAEQTSPVAAPAAPTSEPSTTAQPDPGIAQLLRLWRELHPQGRRAVFAYIAALLVEV